MNTTELFLSSLEILLTTINYSAPVERSQLVLDKNVQKLNEEFYANKIVYRSIFREGILPPVSLVSSDDNKKEQEYRFAFLSLNPSMNEKYMETELAAALNDGGWESYARYYTKACDGLFDLILPDDKYFRDRIAFMKGVLSEGEYHSWEEWTKNYSDDEKKERGKEFLKDTGVIVTDVFPFHSDRHDGKFDMAKMYKTNYLYAVYNRFLIKEVFRLLSDEGYFIVESMPAVEAFLHFIGEDRSFDEIKEDNNSGKLTGVRTYTQRYFGGKGAGSTKTYAVTGYLGRKKVVLIKDFINGSNGCMKRAGNDGKDAGDCNVGEVVNVIKAM